MPTASALDRFLLRVAPSWGLSRIRARAVADVLLRHYEAASSGHRTQSWPRRSSDANVAAVGALATLRGHSRDLVRNNGWARNGLRVIPRNVVGYGITPKPLELSQSKKLLSAWRRWAGSTQCDAAGRMTYFGLQRLVMRGTVEGGEMIIRRRWRRPSDGLAIPMQLQVMEPDFIDTAKTNVKGEQGGEVINGIEFDAIGRRIAYWLFDQHPGSARLGNAASHRVNANDIIHVFDVERAGQERGVPWFASAIVKLKDFDEFEDAQLMRQKIAACFAAFITDYDGDVGAPLVGEKSDTNPLVETIEPGVIQRLPAGKQITTANPPLVTDDGFSVRTLRAIAAGIGVTFEDLTGDYSQVNFSSARMSRLAHWGNVYDWQWNMLIPQYCDPTWAWAMEAAAVADLVGLDELPLAEWTPMPMPMTEPDREARANVTMIRSGQKSLSQVIREGGGDPETVLTEIASDNQLLDKLKIWLDSDPRRTSQAGLTQERVGAGAPAADATPQDGADGNGAADGAPAA